MARFLLVCVLLLILLGGLVLALPERTHQGEASLVATIYPVALLLQDLAPSDRPVTCLVPPGLSPHTWSPRPSDAERCSAAIALISVSPGLDAWTDGFPVTHRIVLQDLLDSSQLRCNDEEHQHHDHDHGHDHGEWDPHFWLDPQRVAALLPKLSQELAEADPHYAEHYRQRALQLQHDYQQQAEALRQAAVPIKGKAFLQFHQSLGYLFERLQLRDAGVINPAVGSNPSPRYLETLLQEVAERDVVAVCMEPQLPRRAAEHIAAQLDLPLCLVDPLGSKAATLSELWQQNLRALLESAR